MTRPFIPAALAAFLVCCVTDSGPGESQGLGDVPAVLDAGDVQGDGPGPAEDWIAIEDGPGEDSQAPEWDGWEDDPPNNYYEESECSLIWPEDPFHAAIYSFVAEYALGLGAIVGCLLDYYPDQTFDWLALELEDGWNFAGPVAAVSYGQQWVDENAADAGQEVFDLVETFKLTIEGGTVSGGLGFQKGGGPKAVECDEPVDTGDGDPTATSVFQIVENPDIDEPGMKCMTRWVDVFGLAVVAESGLTNAQVLHAASVLAELLDNDEDGNVDDPLLMARLQEAEALIPMFNGEGSPGFGSFEEYYKGEGVSAVLFANEVDPSQPGHWGADATVEEILHTINDVGHVAVYPEAFGLAPGSSLLTQAMDVARGGQFLNVPASYPEEAWYHYDDVTCDYPCMAIEYIYWALVSNMGILDDPQTCAGIADEWEPCSKELLQSMDPLVYALITDPQYKLPQSAPDGVYAPPSP